MKVVIDIPKDFTGDYYADKFKDFFSRVITDIDNYKGMCGRYECGRYEKEIAKMFIKAFEESIEANNTCNCQHNNASKNNEPCCRCDSRQTNADRIRNMSDEELAEFLCKVKSDYQWMEHEFPSEEEHGEWEEWLQSEAE